jgi:hypothetical protein
VLFAARRTLAKTLRTPELCNADQGLLERGLPVFHVEPGRADARGPAALPRPPEYRKAHNPNELVMSRRHSIKHPTECQTRKPARRPAGRSVTNCPRYATLSAVK